MKSGYPYFSLYVYLHYVQRCSNVTWKKQYETSLPRELLSEGDEYSVLAVGKSIDHSEDIVGLKRLNIFLL
ncbi:hypothetical protein F3K44_32360 [Bacillus megaterium]|nr:hypothetical protein [Priestia megaterium]